MSRSIQPPCSTIAHPAYAALRTATHTLQARLARALAIEYDWRYHDGPEWAARYWQAFGDLAVNLAESVEEPGYRRVLVRSEWPSLSAGEARDMRTLFRGLLAVAHPLIDPSAAHDARARLWPRIVRAYRRGDRGALVSAWSETRALVRRVTLPDDVAALRAEHDRLAGQVARVDARLEQTSAMFPFNVRDRLDDADWVRRRRRALAQVRAFTKAPVARNTPHKQVS